MMQRLDPTDNERPILITALRRRFDGDDLLIWIIPAHQFSRDSLLEGSGFEPVWGFSCQVVVLGLAESSLFGAGKPFFIPSPTIRFAERAEGVKGPKR